MSYGVLECDIVNVTELHAYGFVIKDFVIKKGALFVPDPVCQTFRVLCGCKCLGKANLRGELLVSVGVV